MLVLVLVLVLGAGCWVLGATFVPSAWCYVLVDPFRDRPCDGARVRPR